MLCISPPRPVHYNSARTRMLEIHPENAADYLRQTGRVPAGRAIDVRALGWGVSNVVLRVEVEGQAPSRNPCRFWFPLCDQGLDFSASAGGMSFVRHWAAFSGWPQAS
jgi:hypothetical protein